MVIGNTSEIVRVMTAFYKQAFAEISRKGFKLTSLATMTSMLSEEHMRSLRV